MDTDLWPVGPRFFDKKVVNEVDEPEVPVTVKVDTFAVYRIVGDKRLQEIYGRDWAEERVRVSSRDAYEAFARAPFGKHDGTYPVYFVFVNVVSAEITFAGSTRTYTTPNHYEPLNPSGRYYMNGSVVAVGEDTSNAETNEEIAQIVARTGATYLVWGRDGKLYPFKVGVDHVIPEPLER